MPALKGGSYAADPDTGELQLVHRTQDGPQLSAEGEAGGDVTAEPSAPAPEAEAIPASKRTSTRRAGAGDRKE